MMGVSRELAAAIVPLLLLAGCSGDPASAAGPRTAVGATLGAIAGGAAGAAIDKNDVRGPLIGAAIGAALGGGIGYALDRQQAELEQALERERTAQQATVERVTDDQLKVTISDQVAFDYKSTAIRPDFLPAIEHVADVLAMSGEAASRARPDLPGRQAELAMAVLDLGKPVVVSLSSGRPLMVPWLFERADAVLATWFLGSETGHAVGDVLSGKHNPSARLPISWPVDVGQIPIFYAQRPSGRPASPTEHYSAKYIDLPVDPQFPFGHGLSYTRFAYATACASRGASAR